MNPLILFYYLNPFVISLLLNILFIFLFALYPGAISVAVNKLLGRGYVFELGKDRRMRIKGAKKDFNCFRTKEGIYEMEYDDIFLFNGSPAGIWYEPYNKAVRYKLMPLLSKLKKFGIETYDDLKFLLTAPLEEVQKVAAEAGDNPELVELAKELRNNAWILDVVEAVKPQDLLDYLEEKNPITAESLIEREVQKERRKMKNTLINIMPWIIAFLMLLFGVAIVWKLITSGGGAALQNLAGGGGSPIKIK